MACTVALVRLAGQGLRLLLGVTALLQALRLLAALLQLQPEAVAASAQLLPALLLSGLLLALNLLLLRALHRALQRPAGALH